MKLTRAGSKNSPIYYVQKSIRVGDKTTTKTVERLGSLEEIKARCGDQDPLEWAREYTKKLTEAEKEQRDVRLKYSSDRLIERGARRECNVGMLFLQDIYSSLGPDAFCAMASEKYELEFDFGEVLAMLVYLRILAPDSRRAPLEEAQSFPERPGCDPRHVARTLEILAKETDSLRSELCRSSQRAMEAKSPGALKRDFEERRATQSERPDFSREDEMKARSAIGLIAQVVCRALEEKLRHAYSSKEIVRALRSMSMLIVPGEGYIPTYTRTELTDALHESFGFRTDYQIISPQSMRKLLNQMKMKK